MRDGFNFYAQRAQRARLAQQLHGPVLSLMSILAIILALGGIGLLALMLHFGWICIAIATVLAMVVEYAKSQLSVIAVDKDSLGVEARLEQDVLAHLPVQLTPAALVVAIMQTRGGHFMAARFALSGNLLVDMANDIGDEVAPILRAADEFRDKLEAELLTGPMLLWALLDKHPHHDAILAHLQLDMEAVASGVAWDLYIRDLMRHEPGFIRTGGVGRDWSYGYIPMLSRFARNVSRVVSIRDYSLDIANVGEARAQLIAQLASGGSVAIVGGSGSGKTTLIESVATRFMRADSDVPHEMRYRQLFSVDSSTLLAYTSDASVLEQLVQRLLDEAYRAKNIVLCFERAELFFGIGAGAVDISTALEPILRGNVLPVVFSIDEQALLQLAQRNPNLAQSLNKIRLQEPGREGVLRVLEDAVIQTEYRKKVTVMYQALIAAYDLSSRYVHEQSMPGRAVRLIDAAADYAEQHIVSAISVERAVEALYNVKVGGARHQDERETLLHLEEKIHERMVNQSHAVQVVSDALRRSRSGVRNTSRPIGTFLFLGPTGVGKTELAKALSEVYFGGEASLIRLDMNEFVAASDVSRLIATGATDAYSLCAQVAKRPFSVVLLDELEKAHPNVVNTLLQVLDEGVLRDADNKEISFRDTILIATTNAAADRVREFIDRGIAIEKLESQFIEELISTGQFKPELLNRFDEVIIFKPLTKDDLVHVLDKIMDSVNATLDGQKVRVTLDDDAKRILIDQAYDPKLGARPMRRIVQRMVENTAAKALLSGELSPGMTLELRGDAIAAQLDTAARADEISTGSPS